MGTWQMAQNKLGLMNQFDGHFNQLIVQILPAINPKVSRKRVVRTGGNTPTDAFVLIVGSERGLCGKFNENLSINAMHWISEQDFQSIRIGAIGSRMVQTLTKLGTTLSWQRPLSTGDLASYRKAYSQTREWINEFETYHFNNLIVLFNELSGENQFEFSVVKLLPYETHLPEPEIREEPSLWPPSIIETDPKGIYNQIIQHYIASTFYKILLRSAIAENSSRYLMMEEAKQNAQEIIEELNREVNNERKRQITQETQELAVGAGLIDNK